MSLFLMPLVGLSLEARLGWSDCTSAFYSHSHHLSYYVGSIYVLIA